ncbi:MAG: DNA translocase FtsK [Planctomycetota bacterium]
MARKPADKPKHDDAQGGEGLSPVRLGVSLTLATAWLFVVAAMVTFDPADPFGHTVWPVNDPPTNLGGVAGAWISEQLFLTLGLSAWIAVALTGGAIWSSLRGRKSGLGGVNAIGFALLITGLCGMCNLALRDFGPIQELGGGTLGFVGMAEAQARIGVFGSFLVFFLAGVLGAAITYDRQMLAAFRSLRGVMTGRVGPAAQQAAKNAASKSAKGLGGALASMRNRTVKVQLNDLDEAVEVDEAELREAEEAERKAAIARKKAKSKAKPAQAEEPDEEELEDEDEYEEDGYEYEYEDDEEPEEDYEDESPGAPQVFSKDELKEKIAKLPVRFGKDSARSATEDDLRDLQGVQELEGYKFPTLDLLEEPEENFTTRLEELVRDQAEALEGALREYKIDGEVTGIESGPVITLYHVKLAPGTRVSALQAVTTDIARALKSVNIRIVTNQAGRDTVGVEVPNPTKEKVRLKELMSDSDRFGKMRLPMFLGKDASGEPLIADLTKMPHMLIAGTTGSGKSVCMNTIIMSFLYTKKPNELKLVLVDPKMVEMSQFKDIPHLMCPVVTEMARAAAILEWAVKKMDERYELLAEAGCRDIGGYNDLDWEELKERFTPHGGELSEAEAQRIPRKLPYMVFIIDELADLMMTNKEVEGSIIRIAQKARAVGIHLILATQRPQANVVTGLIKSNMPCRIAFKVASGMDSRIVLDQKGGELLLGQGDMLFLSPSSHKLSRAQGTLVDDAEIRKVARFMRDVAGPTFERQLVQLRSDGSDEERIAASENNSSASLAAAQEDPMFDRAVEIVLETKRGSVSLLQRRLAIGYTRASRLIDLMGIAGIIGEHKGSVAREVQITPEEWEAMKQLAEEEAADTPSDHPDAPGAARSDLDAGAQAEILEPKPEGLFEEAADRASIAAVETNGNIDDDAPSSAPPFAPTDGGPTEGVTDEAEALTEEPEDLENDLAAEEETEGDGDDEYGVDDEAEGEDEDGDGEEEDESDDDAEAEDEAEGESDDEYEYIYVDEDGNELDPDEVEEDAEADEEEPEDADEDEDWDEEDETEDAEEEPRTRSAAE